MEDMSPTIQFATAKLMHFVLQNTNIPFKQIRNILQIRNASETNILQAQNIIYGPKKKYISHQSFFVQMS